MNGLGVDYLYEKFSTSVGTLADHPGRIKERLRDAYVSQAMRGDVEGNTTLEPAFRERIAAFHSRMVSAPDPDGNGTVYATVEAMTEDEAVHMAQELVSIAHELTRVFYRTHPYQLED